VHVEVLSEIGLGQYRRFQVPCALDPNTPGQRVSLLELAPIDGRAQAQTTGHRAAEVRGLGLGQRADVDADCFGLEHSRAAAGLVTTEEAAERVVGQTDRGFGDLQVSGPGWKERVLDLRDFVAATADHFPAVPFRRQILAPEALGPRSGVLFGRLEHRGS
jgi:hypothetical protein